MTKFGVSTWLWTSPFRTETISLLPKIRKFGFDFVEIAAEDPALIDGRKVRGALDDYGLGAVVCGAWGPSRDLTSKERGPRQASLDYIERSLDLCVQLGGKFLAGPMYSCVGKRRLLPPAERRDEWLLAAEGVRLAAELAAQRGLCLALEPLNRFETDLINTADDVMRFLAEVDHSAAGVMMDSYHMALEERDMEKALCTVGPRLLHVQVSENYRGCPGKGQIRWDAFKRGIAAAHYVDGIAIESFTPEIKELAGAVCFWRPMEPSQDEFATDGLKFLRDLFSG